MNPLSISGLHKTFADLAVLEGVDIEIGEGQFCGLVGANGSGKSTLMRCISAIETANHGSIRIAGHSIADDPVQARAQLGYAVDIGSLPAELTGRQCLGLIAQVRGMGQPGSDTWALADALELSPWLDRRVFGYSLGTRQKLSVSLALLGNPRLILLDESLNGLDPIAAYTLKHHLRQRVRDQGCSVLLATHAIDAVEFWDRAYLLDRTIVRQWDIASGAFSSAILEQQIVEALTAGKTR